MSYYYNEHALPPLIFKLYDTVNDVTYDISDLVGDISIESNEYDSPEQMTCTIYTPEQYSPSYGVLRFWEGAICYVYLGDEKLFKGVLFKKERSEDVRVISCTFYSYLRYMQYSDYYTLENGKSVADVFNEVCEKAGLEACINVSNLKEYSLPDNAYDNKSYYDIIKDCIDKHLAFTGQELFIRDDFGVITLNDILDCTTEFMIGDRSFVTGISYTTDIDTNTYNVIKVVRKTDEDNDSRETIEVKDDTTQKWWGSLQKVEEVDDSYTNEQMQTLADELLKYHDTKNRQLQLNLIGLPFLKAGDLIGLSIEDLGDLPYNSYVKCDSVTHSFSNNICNTSISCTVIMDK